ncbi:MAG: hypothetical protein JXM72_05025 [Deltaproteobacteria bacterium]|nr:hypothetical protein [Deltaproteobacteria bacterium]
MKHQKCMKAGLLIFVVLFIASVSLAGASTRVPLLPDIPEGWSQISPDPDFTYQVGDKVLTPACSNCPGTDPTYRFFVRKGTVNKVVIFFNGGGACWDTMNCIYSPTYNPEIYEFVSSGQLFVDNPYDPTITEPVIEHGIFDFNNADNPFKDWYVVYLPYCTGDLFYGANDYAYPDYLDVLPVDSWPIQHRGFVNFQAVLKWVKDNFRLPRQIFVAGSSAGGYGAIMNYPYIREAFPLTRVYVLSDAANGVEGDNFNSKADIVWDVQIPEWILGQDVSALTIEDIYMNIAARYPLMKFAQYTTAYDQMQVYFYHMQLDNYVQNPGTWYDLSAVDFWAWNYFMNLYTHDTAAAAPNYRYYIGQGSVHMILSSDRFYTESSAGDVSFAGWVKSMVDNPFGFFGGPLQGIWQNLENNNP